MEKKKSKSSIAFGRNEEDVTRNKNKSGEQEAPHGSALQVFGFVPKPVLGITGSVEDSNSLPNKKSWANEVGSRGLTGIYSFHH
ncbi:hypothetical protein U1Q18_046278 [Sarracenia purpurea var. burkii]